jgi:hypothetical protein
VVFRHLADDQVVLVVARDGGHDVRAVGTGLRQVAALASVAVEDDAADLVRDLTRAPRVLLHEYELVARGQQLLGQVVTDLATADDDHVHAQDSRAPSRRCRMSGCCPAASAVRAGSVLPAAAVAGPEVAVRASTCVWTPGP